jgi:hypothetical protein
VVTEDGKRRGRRGMTREKRERKEGQRGRASVRARGRGRGRKCECGATATAAASQLSCGGECGMQSSTCASGEEWRKIATHTSVMTVRRG